MEHGMDLDYEQTVALEDAERPTERGPDTESETTGYVALEHMGRPPQPGSGFDMREDSPAFLMGRSVDDRLRSGKWSSAHSHYPTPEAYSRSKTNRRSRRNALLGSHFMNMKRKGTEHFPSVKDMWKKTPEDA